MSNSWWANKLGAPAPAPQAPSYPTPPSTYTPTPQIPQQNLPPARATSSLQVERCPNCASGNYGRSTPEAKARCYDCGYPLMQSGSGMPGVRLPNAEGAAQPAKQINTQNNFNPGTIVDRIG